MSDQEVGLKGRMVDFKTLIKGLEMPQACQINKPLYKKMFQEHATLDVKDKKALKDDVLRIRWLFTLKPATASIAPYEDEIYDYSELAYLQVELNNLKNAERIAHFINRAIPYPVVIFFLLIESQEAADENAITVKQQLIISTADKRINKVDKDKWVIEELLLSPRVCLSDSQQVSEAFLNSLVFGCLPHSNLYSFYQGLITRIQALQAAQISGRFHLASGEVAQQQANQLNRYRSIENDIKKLRAQIKQAEFSQQVVLNAQIKQQEQRLKQIAETL